MIQSINFVHKKQILNIKTYNLQIEEKIMKKNKFNKHLEDNLNQLKLIINLRNNIKDLLVINNN